MNRLSELASRTVDEPSVRPTPISSLEARAHSYRVRRRAVAVALAVLVVVIVATVLARTSTSSRSVRVPPAQDTNGVEVNTPGDNCIARMEESMRTAPGPVYGFEVFDRGTGVPVRMTVVDYCDAIAALKEHPEFPEDELREAGVGTLFSLRNGVWVTEYVEYTVTEGGGSTDVSAPVPVEVVRERLEALARTSGR